MFRRLLGLTTLVLACMPVSAVAQATMGYDAHGRLTCVYHPTTTPKITRYSYDAAGNRTAKTVVAANGQTCGSQPVGAPPSPPLQLTALNPAVSLSSEDSTTFAMSALGQASDAATLGLVSATTSGGAGACGAAAITTSVLNYTAPTVTPASASLTCYIDYVFSHPNSQQKSGRVTLTIAGKDPGEPCVPNPQTGLCEIE